MTDTLERPPRLLDDQALLIELEPEVARLYDRHAGMAQEWFPHEFIPYRLGRDFDKEPWTPDQPRLTGVAQTSFEIGLLTEDNLPSYHRLIHGMFGKGDGAWLNWVGRWTAEEGRHAIVLRDYLTVTRNIDPIALERGRMTQLQQGYDLDSPDTLHGLAYVTFQELATRIAHRNTGRYSDDPVADKIMVRIATDENLHMVFYRDVLSAAIKLDPSAAVRAIVDEVLAFQMPGAGIPGFIRKAAQIAKAGIYDLRVHRDEVLAADPPALEDLRAVGPRCRRRGRAPPPRRVPREAGRVDRPLRGAPRHRRPSRGSTAAPARPRGGSVAVGWCAMAQFAPVARQSIPRSDLYGDLGVDPSADAVAIEAAYRDLIDRLAQSEATKDLRRAARLRLAHEWLTDPERRSRYDASRAKAAARAEKAAEVEARELSGLREPPEPANPRRAERAVDPVADAGPRAAGGHPVVLDAGRPGGR